ncbi:hypothetical protein M0G43_11730 [Subsaxibacter sp. CAU 1640]|uniref:hypothetical protein n=1 Tax=Subsaxibacter sp. CAU 1640 TaxID=2933271 RepID=UPI002004C516|nr:hypothetical protein [Subsaxibacter sp. CAU 1640]MCK7591247.1 hypothetical protein [Subsaxibacter sp. CAU 1640]
MKHLNFAFIMIAVCFVQLSMSQNDIPYYPSDWDFKNNADIVDISQVRSVTTQEFTIDDNKEYPVFDTYLGWNNTSQLTSYSLTNHLNKDLSFDVQINYENQNGNRIKAIKILDPNTSTMKEERQYTNGSFDVEKIMVKRYLLNVPEPDTFTVTYEGNDDDYIMETVYSPEKSIVKQTKHWFRMMDDGNYKLVKKTYLDPELYLDQTDSIILNQNQKKLEHHIINLSIGTKTEFIHKTRTVDLYGDDYDYDQLERISKEGKDIQRFEYTYDERGNWITKKSYDMVNGKWVYADITRREIAYR